MSRSSPSLALFATSLSLASAAHAGPYKLPWAPGTSMELTQDCNDSQYADHVGSGRFAWDFANGTHFRISAARGGVVTHLKTSSRSGCSTSACVDEANYLVIDHGDGTASIYLHIDPDSLDPRVVCGQPIAQGQHLASAGSTGWSTGPHLHFQVNVVRPNAERTCECGADGKACPENYALWSVFWSTSSYPSQPISFDEWAAPSCQDRRVVLPLSQNAQPSEGTESPNATVVAAAAPPAPTASGVGGRTTSGSRGARHGSTPSTVSGRSGHRKTGTHRPSPPAPASTPPRR